MNEQMKKLMSNKKLMWFAGIVVLLVIANYFGIIG